MHIFRRILTGLLPYRLKMDLLGAGGSGRSEALPQDQSCAGLGLDGAGRTEDLGSATGAAGKGPASEFFGAGLFFKFFSLKKN